MIDEQLRQLIEYYIQSKLGNVFSILGIIMFISIIIISIILSFSKRNK